MSLTTASGLATMDRDAVASDHSLSAAALSETMRGEVAALRATFRTGRTRALTWRKEQLHAILRMLEENHLELTAAIRADHQNSPKIRGFLDLKRAAEETRHCNMPTE